MKSTFLKYIYTFSFVAILAIPFALLLNGAKSPKMNIVEKRNLSEKPDFHDNYTKLPQEYENYLNDNLPFRSQFIANYMQIWEMELSSFIRQYVKGKENQYFPNSKDAPTIDYYLGFNRISLPQLYLFRTVIAGRQAFWQSHDASYLFILVPDKATLYPEFLPDWIYEKHSWFDQLNSILKNTQINYLDFNQVLEEHKNSEKPFFNKIFDTYHWNGYALDLVYNIIAKKFESNTDFHQIKSGDAYTVNLIEIPTGRFFKEFVPWINLKTKNLRILNHHYGTYTHMPWAPCDIVINDKVKNGTLILSTDSYFKQTHQNSFEGATGNIFPFAHNVHKFISVHYLENFSVLEKIAKVEKPDIVIEESAERSGINITMTQSPRILIAGDRLLNESQVTITPEFLAGSIISTNCILRPSGNILEIVAENNDPIVILPAQRTNKDGRFVVMVKMASPVNTSAQVFYAQGDEAFSGIRVITQHIKKGINYLHIPIYAQPDEEIRLRFDPGCEKVMYTIFPMPDTRELFEEGV